MLQDNFYENKVMLATEVITESLFFLTCLILMQYKRYDLDYHLAIDIAFISAIIVLALVNIYFVVYTVR